MVLAIPSLLRGQLVSDEVPRDRTVTAQEQLDEDLKDSRYHLGPMRLLPGFEVNNAGYNSNVFGSQFNPVGDWTATLGLGTKVIIPFGSKIYFVGDAFPTYTWYANFSNLDTWGGHAKASIAGYFNRLSFEFGGNGFQGIAAPTPEQPQPTLEKTADAFAHVEVDLTHKLGLFLGGEAERVRQTQENPVSPGEVNVARNDRTDQAYDGGLRLALGSWVIAPEVQYTNSQFVLTPEERNNTSTGYLLGVSYNQPKFFLNLIGGYREGEAFQGSTFPAYATPVGSYFVSYFLRPWLEIRTYGARRMSYSISSTNPYYFSNSIGGGLNIQVLPRVLLRGYAETGENKYPIPQPVGPVEVQRLDRVLNYGGGVSAIVYKKVTLTGLVTHKQDDSNIPGNSYSLLQFSTYLTFTGEFLR